MSPSVASQWQEGKDLCECKWLAVLDAQTSPHLEQIFQNQCVWDTYFIASTPPSEKIECLMKVPNHPQRIKMTRKKKDDLSTTLAIP